ncbi:izumo sperm-egg fusion protein 1 [Struthio camelus]|uniref:izumo sperm-egg fusion protein 1 n=1 Tax=Struthio camelus TaxID=8801 RepID=UPI0036041BFA
MEQDHRDERIFNELYWALQEVKDHFELLMRRFQREVFCPNTCGRMEQVWIDCESCNASLFACARGLLCGERRLSVAADEDPDPGLRPGLAPGRPRHQDLRLLPGAAGPPPPSRGAPGPPDPP